MRYRPLSGDNSASAARIPSASSAAVPARTHTVGASGPGGIEQLAGPQSTNGRCPAARLPSAGRHAPGPRPQRNHGPGRRRAGPAPRREQRAPARPRPPGQRRSPPCSAPVTWHRHRTAQIRSASRPFPASLPRRCVGAIVAPAPDPGKTTNADTSGRRNESRSRISPRCQQCRASPP